MAEPQKAQTQPKPDRIRQMLDRRRREEFIRENPYFFVDPSAPTDTLRFKNPAERTGYVAALTNLRKAMKPESPWAAKKDSIEVANIQSQIDERKKPKEFAPQHLTPRERLEARIDSMIDPNTGLPKAGKEAAYRNLMNHHKQVYSKDSKQEETDPDARWAKELGGVAGTLGKVDEEGNPVIAGAPREALSNYANRLALVDPDARRMGLDLPRYEAKMDSAYQKAAEIRANPLIRDKKAVIAAELNRLGVDIPTFGRYLKYRQSPQQ